MGTWGPGNFDNDLARDYLADVIRRFEQFIESILAGDIPNEEVDLDNLPDAGEHYLVPTVQFIIAIHEALGSDYLPSPVTVARWVQEYPRRVEPLMKEIDAAGFEKFYVKERRPVVAATFKRLLELSRTLYKVVEDEKEKP